MKGEKTPEQLIAERFALIPKCDKSIPKKNRIAYQEFGSDGKLYSKIRRMSKQEQRVFDESEEENRSGKCVYLRFEPFNLMLKFPYDIGVEKDKRGNVTVIISKK